MTILYWLFIVFLITYEPIYGYADFQRFKLKVRSYPLERISYYKKVMLGLWIPSLFIIGLIIFGPITLQDIGLQGITINPAALGKWPTYITLGLAVLYLVSILYYVIGSKISKKIKKNLSDAQKKQLETSTFADILPVSKEDKKVWTLVSWTAGITEEIIYRGFLIFALTQLFPNFTIWLTLVISSVFFGLAHTYQGIGNVIRTTLIGLFFAVLYIGLGSIIPLILFHFLVDYLAKIGDEAADQTKFDDSTNNIHL
ncbi:CPBP family intramembrane glutamic endopeptidase [Niallia oryzisoli]|uniref:CPBP family intramembrane glutamic endopeptidase n=1 Tax=Niallia oryzisoli TaxID=1737571 RepID=UPI0037363342